MENYEQKYKEALERARKINSREGVAAPSDWTICEVIFPELRESEDERIRKGLIKGLSAMRDIHKHQTFSDDAINIDDAIAWLEKQGEKSDYNPYKATVESITTMVEKYASGNLRDFYDNIKVKCKDAMEYDNTWIEKQGEQPYWSEEDELMIQDAIHWIKEFQKSNRCNDENDMQSSVTCENWLKSLKDRVQPQSKQEWSENDLKNL